MSSVGDLRGWRGVLAALFVLVLALGPGLDTLVCADDIPAAAQAHDHPQDPDGADETHDLCQHGHCHPGGAVAPAGAAVKAPEGLRAPKLIPPSTAREADRQFGLIRPPRA